MNKLSNLLEAIDNKAAETASKNKNEFNDNNYGNDSALTSLNDSIDDIENPQNTSQEKDTEEELEELKQQAHQDQVRLVTLEEQLKEAMDENSKLGKLLSASSEKDKASQSKIQQMKRELITLKANLDLKNRQIQSNEEWNSEGKFNEILTQLKNELNLTKEENDQLQSESSNKEKEILEIENKINEKNEIIKKFESELSETRTKAIHKLTDSVESSEFLSNIEKFEKQRTDLKESIQKGQQKVAALEASIHELQEEANSEIKEEKASIETLQTELFKTKTANETTKHEIELINNQSKQELLEIEKTYQNSFENEKKMNEKEISRIRFRLESDTINQDRNINLLKAQSEIDQLQIKKAELLAKIEKQKSLEKAMKKRLRRYENEEDAIPLVTLLPHSTIDTLYQPVEKFDKFVTKIGHFFQKHPIYRVLAVLLLFVCNLAFLIHIVV